MKFSSLKNIVCGVIAAAALCGGGNLFAEQILIRPPVVLTNLGDALWQSFVSATNGRTETIFTNGNWAANGLLYGVKGFTALNDEWALEARGNYLPATAITRRHLYVRGHDNGATNGGLDTAAFAQTIYVFRAPDGTPLPVGVQAALKRYGGGVDYCILICSNDLPDWVQPLRMADPAALAAKLASTGAFWWPRHNVLLATCQHYLVGGRYSPVFSNHSFYQGGDSGSPDFYLMNNEMIFVQGRSTSGWSPQMQADADTLTRFAGLDPANYQIQLLDLTQFQ